MKIAATATVLLALLAFSSQADAWKPPHGCAKYCVVAPWHYTYNCPKYCKSETCYNKHWQKGVKCLPTPAPSPSPTPLPKGCAKICVFYPWKYGYKCPHYCMEKPCYKHHQKKGFKCVPTPPPTPSPSPLPKGCAKVCVPTPWLYKYSCPYYCITKPCYSYHKKGIKCLPKPSPSPSPKPKPSCDHKCVIHGQWKVHKSCNPYYCKVIKCSKWHLDGLQCVKKSYHVPHKPKPACANKCVSAHELDKEGCDELKCQVTYCKTKHYRQRYVKCSPISSH